MAGLKESFGCIQDTPHEKMFALGFPHESQLIAPEDVSLEKLTRETALFKAEFIKRFVLTSALRDLKFPEEFFGSPLFHALDNQFHDLYANALDAGATEIKIKFIFDEASSVLKSIELEDNGHGFKSFNDTELHAVEELKSSYLAIHDQIEILQKAKDAETDSEKIGLLDAEIERLFAERGALSKPESAVGGYGKGLNLIKTYAEDRGCFFYVSNNAEKTGARLIFSSDELMKSKSLDGEAADFMAAVNASSSVGEPVLSPAGLGLGLGLGLDLRLALSPLSGGFLSPWSALGDTPGDTSVSASSGGSAHSARSSLPFCQSLTPVDAPVAAPASGLAALP